MMEIDEDADFHVMCDDYLKVEWKIKRFYNLPKIADYSLSSPSFRLSDSKWSMEIWPNGEKKNKYSWISLYLKKERSRSNVHIDYTIGIMRNDGYDYPSFNENCEFKKGCRGWGTAELIPIVEMLDFKDVVAIRGVVTVYCFIRIINGGAVARVVNAPQASTSAAGSSLQLSQNNADKRRIKKLEELLSEARKGIKVAIENYQKYDRGSKPGDQTLPHNFRELFLTGYQSDVKLRVKGREFLAHRLILGARSPVFRVMFETNMTERNNRVVNIDDCDPDSFEDFLLFLYSGQFGVVNARNALKLCLIADKYSFAELKKACFECLSREISTESVCDAVYVASLYDEQELLKTATNFFIKNMDKIVSTPKWLSFLTEHQPLANRLLVNMARYNVGESITVE